MTSRYLSTSCWQGWPEQRGFARGFQFGQLFQTKSLEVMFHRVVAGVFNTLEMTKND